MEKKSWRDFVEEFWHFDNVTKQSEEQFIGGYLKWAKKKVSLPSHPVHHQPKC